MASDFPSVLNGGPSLLCGLSCNVHPVVLLNIVDSYERRNEEHKRVIGTLLGNVDKGVVEITNCFSVPHSESNEEVAVDIEFAKNMLDLYRKVNPFELIVGWYSTGSEVTDHSVLIHDFYSRECKSPIHMTVDTSLRGTRMGIKAYISVPLGIPEKTQGIMFSPIPLNLICYEPEKSALDYMIKKKESSKRLSTMPSDLKQVFSSCNQVLVMIEKVISYVDEVLEGKLPSDPDIGRLLTDLSNNVTKIEPDLFQQMINTNIKDLLMMVYLSSLTKTQLNISEKLHQQD